MPNTRKRIIDLTEEALAALPIAAHSNVVYYDRTRPYWCARKTKQDGSVTYMVKTTRAIQRAAARAGHKVRPLVTLGTMPLEEARSLAIKTWEELNSNLVSGSLPIPPQQDDLSWLFFGVFGRP